ncbi:hypothetical protein [Nocardia terpenica]|uniref:Uncharacterized protein n=1 Tax=Nocardia terpenica TaxID=455432 RepID=A0A161XCW4_9NOCA|nr:hypothetical protein [Nocardia terpenica]KZM71108.1 hypothetical protein AWN90_42100 [Nocardia terpenica]NQE89569.1 hypothetical protein [Nocardia terpenica]
MTAVLTAPKFEIRQPANHWTAISIGPARTLVRIGSHHRNAVDDIATLAVILRERLGEDLADHPKDLERTWSGSPDISRNGTVYIRLRNRGRTIHREYRIGLDEIRSRQAEW